jgi:tetratricopeptide (TPR) repeat protein
MPGSEPENPGSSPGSSSSSSSSDSPDTPASDKPPLGDKGENPHPSGRRRLPKVEKLQSDEERAEEDLKVSKFYEDAGNLNAAYLRARDAVKSLPDDPDTHFALAHVAEKMKKRDEAIAEYNNYLRMNPDGLKIKDAHKALSALER